MSLAALACGLVLVGLVSGFGMGWLMRWARHPCYGCFRCSPRTSQTTL